MQSINEKTTLVVELAFKDENDLPATPTAVGYSLYNYTSNYLVSAMTTITVTSHTHDLEIGYSNNTIINSDNKQEMMVLTVDFTYDIDKRGTAEYKYLIKNLKDIN